MRLKLPDKLEAGRLLTGSYASRSHSGPCGAFRLQGPCGALLAIIASDSSEKEAAGWEHVSVSTDRRPPNWQEMCFIKRLFWYDTECVVQFHPPESDYVNFHPYTLHLWRHVQQPFPMPPLKLI